VTLALLLLGGAVGVAAVWVHGRWWALALGVAATLTAEWAAPAGLLRLAFAAGWVAVSAWFLLSRPEGDFVVGSDPTGYAFLVLALVVVVLGVATIPPRRRLPRGGGPTT
jgi:hypothetical protein